MSLERFARRMRRRANNVPREVNKVKRRTALAIDQAVVLSTPVKTGTARSNWLVSLGSPNSNVIKAYSPLDKGDISETENAQAAIAQGQGMIAKSKHEQDIHLTNNLDYIVDLNQGTSAQAPAAFVEEAVDAGIKAAKATRIDTGARK